MLGEQTREWVDKAEGDWRTAENLMAAGPEAYADSIAFHAQQCAEKYLKALVVWRDGREPEHRHELRPLLELLMGTFPELGRLGDACDFLSDFAVASRYPGRRTTPAVAFEARQGAAQIRAEARDILGLDRQLRMDLD